MWLKSKFGPLLYPAIPHCPPYRCPPLYCCPPPSHRCPPPCCCTSPYCCPCSVLLSCLLMLPSTVAAALCCSMRCFICSFAAGSANLLMLCWKRPSGALGFAAGAAAAGAAAAAAWGVVDQSYHSCRKTID